MEKIGAITQSTKDKTSHEQFMDLFEKCPISDEELINHIGLFIKRQNMSRIIFFYELYKRIVNVHGSIMGFGVRWGQDMALLSTFRGMLEPFNYNRKIVGFDTFGGFPTVSAKDKRGFAAVGDMKVADRYEAYLEKLLQAHEDTSPLAHIRKFDLVKGDATKTFKSYLDKHPETIIALAYFDFDIYEPTKVCLELCRDHLTKGSIIAFDELNHPDWPGETLALKEVFGVKGLRIERFPFMPTASYAVIE
jgi:hypothetical protein